MYYHRPSKGTCLFFKSFQSILFIVKQHFVTLDHSLSFISLTNKEAKEKCIIFRDVFHNHHAERISKSTIMHCLNFMLLCAEAFYSTTQVFSEKNKTTMDKIHLDLLHCIYFNLTKGPCLSFFGSTKIMFSVLENIFKMWCDQAKWVRTHKILILRYSQTKQIIFFFCFLLFLQPFKLFISLEPIAQYWTGFHKIKAK